MRLHPKILIEKDIVLLIKVKFLFFDQLIDSKQPFARMFPAEATALSFAYKKCNVFGKMPISQKFSLFWLFNRKKLRFLAKSSRISIKNSIKQVPLSYSWVLSYLLSRQNFGSLSFFIFLFLLIFVKNIFVAQVANKSTHLVALLKQFILNIFTLIQA